MDSTTPRLLGKSDLAVTPLGFGGGTIGSPQVSNDDSLATVAAAWETGVRFYDTAPWYGIGRSERRLGLALSALAPREAFRVNTKIGKTLVPEPVRDEGAKTLSPGGEVRTPRDPVSGFRVQVRVHLRCHHGPASRLAAAARHVVGRQPHDPRHRLRLPRAGRHRGAPSRTFARDGGGGARALEELRASGRISAIGCGCNLESRNAWSWDDARHEDLSERIAETVDLDFFVVAGGYTLLETRALRRIFRCAPRAASGW